MTTKQHILSFLFILLTLTAVDIKIFAQVKVGSNPTTIGTASNLEIEAANGNKTIINKTTGQMTVQDGTQGAGKVFTSDAAGGASWVAPTAPAAANTFPFAAVLSNTRQQFATSASGNTQFELKSDGESFDPTNSYVPTTGRFTATTAGYYLFSGAAQFDNTAMAGTPGFTAVVMTLRKNFGLASVATLAQYAANPGGSTINSGSLSTIVYLNAGDYVSLTTGAQVNSGSIYQVISLSFYGYKFAN
ncbi:C1q-like domain-containing protein [Runella slithyformis]|uniref:C1q domain-containing protein n=1 Tax=Runella slithyformis (strain ATCC 29530 / DSM 19594 / LMG 11500 / NCIMB 11436 / LSU 4) TaxID=761193 RepID=A0A7U3ZQC1_RUNSL|nr:hypothetical protein [Runella slithyformis]AEI51422.1 hypothetical protein Runsl_5120 [Runella slithyformis DSM 19594]